MLIFGYPYNMLAWRIFRNADGELLNHRQHAIWCFLSLFFLVWSCSFNICYWLSTSFLFPFILFVLSSTPFIASTTSIKKEKRKIGIKTREQKAEEIVYHNLCSLYFADGYFFPFRIIFYCCFAGEHSLQLSSFLLLQKNHFLYML